MNNISTEQLEQKIEAGEEVIDRYFDATTTRLGMPRVMTSRRHWQSLPERESSLSPKNRSHSSCLTFSTLASLVVHAKIIPLKIARR
jgi:hypothetical protein